jgi:hypothetical protein
MVHSLEDAGGEVREAPRAQRERADSVRSRLATGKVLTSDESTTSSGSVTPRASSSLGAHSSVHVTPGSGGSITLRLPSRLDSEPESDSPLKESNEPNLKGQAES